MSTQYNIEPPSKGQCVLHTTSGDIFLELFAQQTPLASRNFLQLILDGYYNDTIFHRLVPGFILQGGDPTGTGSGGASSYDGGLPFADEFHSRLKFNRRGLLGMANGGAKDDNGSQFFLTLGPSEELTGKHTMFGRVAGNTIFNLVKIGEADLVEGEGSDRPLYPTKITRAEILENPFDDMEPRRKVIPVAAADAQRSKKKPKKTATKNKLSFAADDDDETLAALPQPKRAKYNVSLINGGSDAPVKSYKTLSKPKNRSHENPPPLKNDLAPRGEAHVTTQIREDVDPILGDRGDSKSPELLERKPKTTPLERTNAKIAELKASLKRNRAEAPSQITTHKSALESMIPSTATKGRKRGTGAVSAADEQRNLQAFNAFKQKLSQLDDGKPSSQASADSISPSAMEGMVPATNAETLPDNVHGDARQEEDEATLCDLHFIANCQSCSKWDKDGNVEDDYDNEDGSGWMTHSLSFAKDRLGKDLEWKRKNEEELVVIDPREKAKTLAGSSQKNPGRRNKGH